MIHQVPFLCQEVLPKIEKAKQKNLKWHKVTSKLFLARDQIILYNEIASALQPK